MNSTQRTNDLIRVGEVAYAEAHPGTMLPSILVYDEETAELTVESAERRRAVEKWLGEEEARLRTKGLRNNIDANAITNRMHLALSSTIRRRVASERLPFPPSAFPTAESKTPLPRPPAPPGHYVPIPEARRPVKPTSVGSSATPTLADHPQAGTCRHGIATAEYCGECAF